MKNIKIKQKITKNCKCKNQKDLSFTQVKGSNPIHSNFNILLHFITGIFLQKFQILIKIFKFKY